MEEAKEKLSIIPRRYSLSEELISSISHGVGTGLAITGLVLCIIKAVIDDISAGVVSATLYGSSVILLYLMSTLYHSFSPNIKAKKVFRVFDHCSIFLLIFGTYVPFTLITLRGAIGWTLFGIILATAIVGIVLNAISVEKFRKFSMACYLLMGWAIIFTFDSLCSNLEANGVLLLTFGGIVYSLGAIVYGVGKKVKYMHCVWHFFVLAATILQFFAIYWYVL